MSVRGVPSAREGRAVGKSAGHHAVPELSAEPTELGVFRVYRNGAGDPQRVVQAGTSVYRIQTTEDLRDLLRPSDLAAPSAGDDLHGGAECLQRAVVQRHLTGPIVSGKLSRASRTIHIGICINRVASLAVALPGVEPNELADELFPARGTVGNTGPRVR